VQGGAQCLGPLEQDRQLTPLGLVPDLVVAGVLQDAAPGGLEDPPVGGRAEPLDVGAEQPDQDRGDGDGAGLVAGAVLQAAFLAGGALVGPGPPGPRCRRRKDDPSPPGLAPAVSDRYLSFAERESVAVWRAQKAGRAAARAARRPAAAVPTDRPVLGLAVTLEPFHIANAGIQTCVLTHK